jgi:hypothetical protein
MSEHYSTNESVEFFMCNSRPFLSVKGYYRSIRFEAFCTVVTYCGLWCHVVWWGSAVVCSDTFSASVFRAEDESCMLP